MLIIFDLDDTLVDTSGCLTPERLKVALQRLIEAGLQVADFSSALELLLRLDASASSAKEAIAEFLELYEAEPTLASIAIKEVYEAPLEEALLFPLDSAIELLEELKKTHKLALVTVGLELQQRLKLKKAGIDSSIFSRIIVSGPHDKKRHYRALLDEFMESPSHVVVCGDRIKSDLTPAKELGFKTIHVRWGRGVNAQGSSRDVDFVVLHLAEIGEIIKRLAVGVT